MAKVGLWLPFFRLGWFPGVCDFEDSSCASRSFIVRSMLMPFIGGFNGEDVGHGCDNFSISAPS